MLISKLGKTGLVLSKYAPQILVATGVVSVVGGTVLACKATLRAPQILEKHNNQKRLIDQAVNAVKENPELKDEYTKKEKVKDLVSLYTNTSMELLKIYALPIALTAGGIACFLGAHNILVKRNLALMVAYKGLSEYFDKYKKRTTELLGEKASQISKGIREEVIEVEDENGKKKKETIENIDSSAVSPYAKFFDESNDNWSKSPEYNRLFLEAQQNYANDLLRRQKHLFLNEVYDMLDLPRTKAGSVVGWIYDEDCGGDNMVDFGLYNGNNAAIRRFVNGEERSILLDFNVDGVIYDNFTGETI